MSDKAQGRAFIEMFVGVEPAASHGVEVAKGPFVGSFCYVFAVIVGVFG